LVEPVGPIFRHGVASGDPLQDRVVIWTRVTTEDGRPVSLAWWLEDAAEPQRRRRSGDVQATADRDWTVSVDVDGLEPGRRYRYGFAALGETSVEGRTRTLPGNDIRHLRLGQVSCAKFNAGFYNAYRRLAERDDLDAIVHLGDFIYEASNTPPKSQTPGADIGRPFDPLHECRTLVDYRTRYAQGRADPDVQAASAAHPFIATLDDHEFADGAWRDGAQEHVDERDGPWSRRKADAFRARAEWLPIRPPDPADPSRVFRTVHFGRLVDLFLIDTRTRRDQPVPPPDSARPQRTALGPEQRDWLFGELARSTARWRILGNPSVMARTWNDELPGEVKAALVKVKLIDADGTGPDYDQWDGYPADREALLRQVRDTGPRNVVVLSGDVHVGMAIELAIGTGEEPVAVEFVNTSLTSQNLDDKMGWKPLTESVPLADAYMAGMPHLHWVDFDSHGYNIVDITPERVVVEWWAVDTVLRRTTGQRRLAAWGVRHGTPHVVPENGLAATARPTRRARPDRRATADR
jgi:alkaline phosphatase D